VEGPATGLGLTYDLDAIHAWQVHLHNREPDRLPAQSAESGPTVLRAEYLPAGQFQMVTQCLA